MLPLKTFASFLIALAMSLPAFAQSPDRGGSGALVLAQGYQDPSRPVFDWQSPRAPRAHSPSRQSSQAYWQSQREAQRQWQLHQQRLYNERQRRLYGWQAPPPPRAVQPRQTRPQPRRGPDRREGGPRPEISPLAPEIVALANNEAPGTIIIDTEARTLYYTVSQSEAYAYPVSVGREGFGWFGTETVSRVASWPDWYPPESMRQRQPELPRMMTGGINNPLGARAIYLGDTLYRIHGTNEESSIGRAASSGCFRMRNEHVVHLANMVEVGAKVRVVEHWPDGGMARAGDSG
jgi:lipoprotein-anchoring transpeptidase ErfK/SrfK